MEAIRGFSTTKGLYITALAIVFSASAAGCGEQSDSPDPAGSTLFDGLTHPKPLHEDMVAGRHLRRDRRDRALSSGGGPVGQPKVIYLVYADGKLCPRATTTPARASRPSSSARSRRRSRTASARFKATSIGGTRTSTSSSRSPVRPAATTTPRWSRRAAAPGAGWAAPWPAWPPSSARTCTAASPIRWTVARARTIRRSSSRRSRRTWSASSTSRTRTTSCTHSSARTATVSRTRPFPPPPIAATARPRTPTR